MSYSCVTDSTKASVIYFQVPWAHEKSELQVICFPLTDDDYEYYVADAGNLTLYSEGDDDGSGAKYSYACPFEFEDTTEWAVYVFRKTTTTEDDVEYDGSTIPIEDIVAKFEEHSDKGEETTLEALRSLRVPETDSNAFFPPKSVRADHVAGFDSDGNPTIGENCAEVAELYEIKQTTSDYLEECKAYAEDAEESADASAASADASAASATEAATYASNASASAALSSSYATTAKSLAESASASAASAQAYAEEAQETVDEAEELLVGAQQTAENLIEAIEEAQAGASSSVDTAEDLPTSDDEDSPSAGDVAYVADENALYVYNGTSWEKIVTLSSLVGNVTTADALPTSGNTTGDIYFVTGEGSYYQWDGTQWVCILQASSTVIVYTPAATNLVAGVVKISTSATIDTTNGAGLIGYNSDEQIVVPIASDDYLGVVQPGDSVTVDDYGELTLSSATTTLLGGVLLSSSQELNNDSDLYDYDSDSNYADLTYNTVGGTIGVNSDGQLLARTAMLNRFGVVKLGSKFQPCNTYPYVVGIGASKDTDTYGELMFNLYSGGCLRYSTSDSGTEYSDTQYYLRVLTAGSSPDGFGSVCVLSDISETSEDISTTYSAAALYGALSNMSSSISTLTESVTSALAQISAAEIGSSFRLFYVTDSDGTECDSFSYSASGQTVSIDVKVLLEINQEFFSALTCSVSDDSEWLTVNTSIANMYSYGSVSLTLDENTDYTTRSATITYSYYTQYVTITITQDGASLSTETVTATTDGGEVAVSSI